MATKCLKKLPEIAWAQFYKTFLRPLFTNVPNKLEPFKSCLMFVIRVGAHPSAALFMFTHTR